MNADRAGTGYWDAVWDTDDASSPIDPSDRSLNNYPVRRFHDHFRRLFAGRDTRGMSLLEIGCARSQWLPYFAREFGFRITGLDYSERGCEQERRILARAGLDGEVVQCDLFDPPAALRGKFDVVVSFGVVEHFTDTTGVVRAMASYLEPGGLLFVNMPNMTGAVGAVQKVISRSVYAVHVPIGARALAQAFRDAGCQEVACRHFMSTSFGVVNPSGGGRLRHRAWVWLTRLSKVVWVIEGRVGTVSLGGFMAPYVNCSGILGSPAGGGRTAGGAA